MAKEDLQDLGFKEKSNIVVVPRPERKEKEGFVAGIRRKPLQQQQLPTNTEAQQQQSKQP